MKATATSTSNASINFKSSPRPSFPIPGSTTCDGKYFSLGKLGRGTFCEISKCADLSYHHTYHNSTSTSNSKSNSTSNSNNSQQGDQEDAQSTSTSTLTKRRTNGNTNKTTKRLRICAAKVELATYTNSGVLDGEANILRHLSHNMNNQTPTFVDYILPGSSSGSGNGNGSGNKGIRVIIMEYLPGEDMHQLRDRHIQISAKKAAAAIKSSSSSSNTTNTSNPMETFRRLKIQDAVYLCADIILPLLQSMHECGMIHRDVKPSNLVRTGIDEFDKKFKLVDFGLSKSFIVSKDSIDADLNHVWKKHSNDSGSGNNYMRKERPDAEFRGTSMYASLCVHQGKDHCRRDDIWGLLYVFCDLVSGGLPWMGYAQNRDRGMCQKIKEWVIGERQSLDNDITDNVSDRADVAAAAAADQDVTSNANGTGAVQSPKDHIDELLKGAEYHLSKYKQDISLTKNAAKQQKEGGGGGGGKSPPLSSSSSSSQLSTLPTPLAMSKDINKINALRKAFTHISSLQFTDEPDYNLIQSCIKEFVNSSTTSTSTTTTNYNSSEKNKDNEQQIIIHQQVIKEDEIIPELKWKQPSQKQNNIRKWEKISKHAREYYYCNNSNDMKNKSSPDRQSLTFVDTDDIDPLNESILDEAEGLNQLSLAQQLENANNLKNGGMDGISSGIGGGGGSGSGSGIGGDELSNYNRLEDLDEIEDLKRLPLQLQFHLAQVEYNASHHTTIPIHLALRDWMKLASCLVYDTWDTTRYERGNHRSNNDKYRRDVYMRLIRQCLDAAKPFDNFCKRECFYHSSSSIDDGIDGKDNLKEMTTTTHDQNGGMYKKRKILVNNGNASSSDNTGDTGSFANNSIAKKNAATKNSSLLIFSKVFCALNAFYEKEGNLRSAPPPVLTFGGNGSSR